MLVLVQITSDNRVKNTYKDKNIDIISELLDNCKAGNCVINIGKSLE